MPTATEKNIKVGKLYRDFFVRKEDINVDKRTVNLSFSSETDEVLRHYGVEILDHSPGACDLTRLKRAGALLIDHDPRNQVGVIEEVTIGADRKGRAVVRFGRSAKAEEIFQDVVDGIRKNVSCGYDSHDMVLERQQEDGPDVYRVTKWTPFEISLVSIPADISVGVGRGEGKEEREITVKIPVTPAAEPPKPEVKPIKEVRVMKKCEICGADLPEDGKCTGARHAELEAAMQRSRTGDIKQMEEGRKKAITNLCTINNLGDNYRDMWIGQGATLEQVADDLLTLLEERGKKNPQPLSRVGLTETETQKFSITRAIKACVDKDWKDAGFELEASRAVAQKIGRVHEPMKFFIPFEVLDRPVVRGKRDLTVGVAGAGGFLVGTENQGFIEVLRNRSVALSMGARRLSGLTGSVTIPRQSAAATGFWLSTEATGITESDQTFVQVALTPKSVGAYTEISRQLLLQSSPGAEGIVSDDLAQVVAVAADRGVLEGTGASGQPTGIANTAGIGSVSGTSLGSAGIIEFMSDVAVANVSPLRPGYVTTPAIAALLMTRPELPTTGTTRLWTGDLWDGAMFGIPAMSSNQLTAATMIFGCWQEIVVAEWGVLEVEVNPYANFAAGIIGVRAIYSMDVGVRRPFAFSRATSIT